MRDRILTWILQARAGDRTAAILAGLPDSRRAAVEELLAQPEADPDGEILRQRCGEVDLLETRGKSWLGPAWHELNPAVKRHAWRRILDHVGEDSQG